MYKYFLLTFFISFSIFADDEPTFPGLVSSEVFNLGNGMVMHVERRNSCNQDGTPKHFHPAAGTLVYVLDGTSQSKSSGDWKNYSKNEYWFERSDWVHGVRQIRHHYQKELANNFWLLELQKRVKTTLYLLISVFKKALF